MLRLICLLVFVFYHSIVAAAPSCTLIFSTGLLGGALGYGKKINYSSYEVYDRTLFLSDGIADTFGYRSEVRNESGAFSLAERISERFPEKEVTQGDFNIEGDQNIGNLRQLFVDNSQPLPFAENSFDLVILRKGMCLCSCRAPCAGFSQKYEGSLNFFKEVIRVMDLSNPNALAILHGQERSDPKVLERWKRIATELESQFPVKMDFGYARPRWGFLEGDRGIDAIPQIRPEPLASGDFNAIYIRPIDHIDKPLPPL